jgi:hypothetical protein
MTIAANHNNNSKNHIAAACGISALVKHSYCKTCLVKVISLLRPQTIGTQHRLRLDAIHVFAALCNAMLQPPQGLRTTNSRILGRDRLYLRHFGNVKLNQERVRRTGCAQLVQARLSATTNLANPFPIFVRL